MSIYMFIYLQYYNYIFYIKNNVGKPDVTVGGL